MEEHRKRQNVVALDIAKAGVRSILLPRCRAKTSSHTEKARALITTLAQDGHGKIDKETQSPLLNIFKEIMTREKDDPEKRILLNEPKEDKKRRQYSGSRNKADRRSCDSSSSEYRKKGSPYKISSTEQRADFPNKARNQNMPYQSEKKDSWWFWNSPPTKTEDSGSCGSCALKKIVSSEYACIGCLLLVFTISIVVAFLVVFKNVPNIGGDCNVIDCKECKESTTGSGPTTPKCKECKGVADSERLKRKIEMLSNKRLKKGLFGVNEFRKNDDKGYDDVLSHIGIPGVYGINFGPSFHELNSMEESEHKQWNDIDLSKVLDPNNMDIQNSEKLREFYKKLVQTDAKIKSLKKITQDESPYEEDDVQKSPERSRRSLKLYHYPKKYRVLRQRRSLFGKHQKVNETSVTKTKFGNRTRMKRFNNEGEEPTGFIIEKKKLLVQYKPAGKKRIPVKKCQHAPVGTHTHEKQMMHPFYKNTQKLDLLLDTFLNKNLPEIISDPFGLNELFNHEKPKKPCKHPKPQNHKNVNIIADEQLVDQIPKPKLKFKNIKDDKIGSTTPDLFKILRPEYTNQYERDFYNHEAKMIGKLKKKIVTASPNDFEVLLSVSTIINPESKLSKKLPTTKSGLIDKVPNLRRLMQLEAGEDEENLGYEDFKEVLTDDMDNHDEMEKSADRNRRDVHDFAFGEIILKDQLEPHLNFPKFNPPQTLQNPNWKGAMPLYPDEINSMIANKVDLPKPSNEIQELLAGQRKGRDSSDIEYVEDYLANKYDRLVQQAQAYSDYGVLDEKKESRNEKDSPTADSSTNHKIKLSADENFHKAGLLARLKRGRVPRVITSNASEIKRKGAFVSDIEINTPAQTGIRSNYLKVASPPIHKSISEGIRIEMMPTTKSREDTMNNLENIIKLVSKHVKLKPKQQISATHDDNKLHPHYVQSTLMSTCPELGLVHTTKSGELTTETTKDFKSLEELERERELLFAMTKGNRRLLSTGTQSSSNFRDYKDSFGYRRGNTEFNRNSVERFVQKLHMNKDFNSSDEIALKNYIEGVKKMNIKIFSTPGPVYDSSSFVSESRNTISEERIPITDPMEVVKDPLEVTKVYGELPDSEVTINKSLVKVDTGDSFLGKIFLTVKNPEFGVQNFNLMFDVPLIMNFKDELMMMSDNINYPNVYNQFEIYNESAVDPQVSDVDSYLDHDSEVVVQNETIAKRPKRKTNVTATSSDSFETREYTIKDFNLTESEHVTEATTVTIMSSVSSGYINSYVPTALAVSLTAVNNNRSVSSSPALKNSFRTNATVAKGDKMTLSEFFNVISNWFRTLEYGKGKSTRNSSGSGLTNMLLTINGNPTNESNVSSTDSVYPMYDSDMIENIGHRSRVLLSVEDNVSNVTEEATIVISNNVTKVTAASTAAEGNVFNSTTLTTPIIGPRSNLTTTKKQSQDKKTFPTSKKDNKTKVKAIVKRNADHSNLVFWNDIYDDEYGIQTDKIDNYMKDKLDDAVRDQHSVKEKDFIKRSGRWIQTKIRKFAKNLKINPHSNDVPSVHSDSMETKERVPRSIGLNKNNGLVATLQTFDRYDNRVGRKEKGGIDKIEEDYPDVDQKSLFAALSINMKEVCKKAAKTVQQTRNVDSLPDNLKISEGAKDESKQGSIANALIQQLVRLLTDLVDYQVQQKTCTKLPSDLKTFLEWLTYSKEETEDPDNQSDVLFKGPKQEDEEFIDDVRDKQEDKSEFPDEELLRSKQESADVRTRYQNNIYGVQDLLEQYDDMTDDEKSKMLGVRDYLEQQLAFLSQQLSAYDLYKFFDKRDINRKKRDIYIVKQHSTKHRPRRRPYKFMKNFGKKHTRSTAGYHDEAQVTEVIMNRKTIKNEEINSVSDKNVQQKLTKRNLKDVYYKAVEEAKKFSSAKIIHKKDESSLFQSSTTMRHK